MTTVRRFLPLAGLLSVLFLVAVLGTALADNGAPPDVDSEPARVTGPGTGGEKEQDREGDAATGSGESSPAASPGQGAPGSAVTAEPPASGAGAVPADPGAADPRDLPLNYRPYVPGGTGGTTSGDDWDDGWDDGDDGDGGDDDWDDGGDD